MHITLNYKCILYTGEAYTNYLTSSLNIFVDKTLVLNSNIPFTHLSTSGKPYYSNSLFLNGSINLTSIGL